MRAEQARAGGPIKGVPNRVWDVFAEREMLGRFGWKANVATLAHQTRRAPSSATSASRRAASPTRPARRRRPTAWPRRAAARGDGAPRDRRRRRFDHVVFYEATLAPPARRSAGDPAGAARRAAVRAGAVRGLPPARATSPAGRRCPRLPQQARCSGQTIRPYTDLLLHDMGEELADGRPDFAANGRQWRRRRCGASA